MGRLTFTACLLVSLFLFGCNLGDLKDDIVVADVEDEFYIDLWEDLRPNYRNFQLLIETVDTYDCTNYSIKSSHSIGNASFNISITDIEAPGDCQPGTATATDRIDLGELNAGFYQISLNLKETVENKGQLIIREDRYELRMESENGIKLTRNQLFRVPDQAIWGYIAYDDQASASSFADTVVNELSAISSSLVLPNGYYGYFRILNSTEMLLTSPPQSPFIETFFFEQKGSTEEIKAFLAQKRGEAPNAVEIKLFNSNGETF